MRIALLSIAALLLAAPAFAGETDAAQLFADAEKLLHAGNLPAAADAFAAAAKADPENAAYRQRAIVVRRVIAVRKRVDTAEPDAKWERFLVGLHVFYCDNDLVETALEMNRAAHAKSASPTTASLVAETLLDLGRNDEAVQFLAALPKDQLESGNRLLLAIALARTGKKDEAKAAVADLKITDESGPGELYDHARLLCLMGEKDEAAKLLVKSIETSSSKTATRIKKFVGRCQDFKVLADGGQLAAVLAAESKVVESGCSGGSGCGSCPKRSDCGSEKKEPKKTDG